MTRHYKTYGSTLLKDRKNIKTLLVDLDGTLLANRALPLQIDFISMALKKLKNVGGWKKAIRALKNTYEALDRRKVKPELQNLHNDERAILSFSNALDLNPEKGKKVLADIISEIFPTLKKHFTPVPGAKDFLEWAKNKYPLYLATTPVWTESIVQLRLEWAGIDPKWFQAITHVTSMHAIKPDREYYLEILKKFGLKAEECLLIGDDKKKDLPATAVGIHVYIIKHGEPFTPLKSLSTKSEAYIGTYKKLRTLLEDT